MEYILFNRIALIRYVNYLVESLKSCSQKEKKAEVINMPRIAIVDDQEEYLEEICNLIEKFYFKKWNSIRCEYFFKCTVVTNTKWKKNCILIFIY